ncbi:glycosyltransferase family 4 protein [Gordonia sp. OPL2]|uniref:glycosyltransferase family 4 protein n=1 Tax=Gordonia sp. OPL2 TaxID=2486274 RepID=UPI0016559BEA|nr:glycosyltransferase family 4 protein [Gordonia sp. OPL2]
MALNYSPEPTGIAPYAESLARGLQGAGHEVSVVTTYPHYPQWRVYEGYEGVTLDQRVSGVRVKRLRTYVPSTPRFTTRIVMEAIFAVRAMMSSEISKADVVIVISPALTSLLACVARGRLTRQPTPIVAWVQDFYGLGIRETGVSNSSRLQRLVSAVESWGLRGSDAVVAIHDSFEAHLVSELAVDRGRVSVVKNWTHVDGCDRAGDAAEYRASQGWVDDDFVVVHAGNMGKKQDLQNVVRAAEAAREAGYDDMKFVFVGDGSERSAIERAAAGAINIEFHDPVPTDEFPALLASADALLLNEAPGLRGMAVPSKLTSYFFAGRPVVAATSEDTPAADEISRSAAGIRVAPGDPEGLVAALRDLHASPRTQRDLGDRGREYFRSELSEGSAIARFETLISAFRRPTKDLSVSQLTEVQS